MSGERNRIEEIKKRKMMREKELRRKIYILRRIMLVVIAAALLGLVIFGVTSCVGAIQKRRAEEAERIAAEEAAKPTPTPAPVYNSKGIDETFYHNSVFVGNSFIEGMTIYELISDADYFSKVALTVSQATSVSTNMGTVPIIEELNSGKKYDKVFMMFGENEVGWIGNSFFEQYKNLIDTVKEYQPQAKIYLMAITPISKSVSEDNIDGLNIDSVKDYNARMKTLANESGVIYADIFSAAVGTDGYLPKDAATDGVHFGEDYYIKCLKYMQEHCK